jgi:hypothetical protein
MANHGFIDHPDYLQPEPTRENPPLRQTTPDSTILAGALRLPFGSGDRPPGIEYHDGSGFVTVAFFAIDRLNAGQRLGLFANTLDVVAQGRLVVL